MASQDEGDGQEAAVDILSYNISNNDAVQLDPNVEDSQPSPQGGPALLKNLNKQMLYSGEVMNPLSNEAQQNIEEQYFPKEELPELSNDDIPVESGYMRTDENL